MIARLAVSARLASLALLAASGVAGAAELSAVRIDQVRVRPSGEHRVWVSALDGEGRPITALDPSGFTIEEDGRPVEGLRAQPWSELHRDFRLTAVIDAGLMRGAELVGIESAVKVMGEELGPGARLRVAAAGARVRADEVTSGSAGRLAERLGEFSGADAEGVRLFDALLDEERRLLHAPRASGGALLIVTRGIDSGSRAGPLQALAMLTSEERRVPVLLVLVENAEGPESARLARLALRTGGAVRRVSRTDQVGQAVRELLPLARGSWLLSYRAPGWDASARTHQLNVQVELGGRTRKVAQEFAAAEALLPAWWKRPAPWIWTGAVLVALLAVPILYRRRPLFLLVIENGPEEGSWFEVYGAPLTLGAAAGNDLLMFEPGVSRNHAVIERRGRTIEIVDLNSENGTFVNGERVSRRVLADNDGIRLGKSVELTFQT